MYLIFSNTVNHLFHKRIALFQFWIYLLSYMCNIIYIAQVKIWHYNYFVSKVCVMQCVFLWNFMNFALFYYFIHYASNSEHLHSIFNIFFELINWGMKFFLGLSICLNVCLQTPNLASSIWFLQGTVSLFYTCMCILWVKHLQRTRMLTTAWPWPLCCHSRWPHWLGGGDGVLQTHLVFSVKFFFFKKAILTRLYPYSYDAVNCFSLLIKLCSVIILGKLIVWIVWNIYWVCSFSLLEIS